MPKMFTVQREIGKINVMNLQGEVVYEIAPNVIIVFEDGETSSADLIEDTVLVAYLNKNGLL